GFAVLRLGVFRNVTDGVPPRGFVAVGNRRMASLITDSIGEQWLSELYELRRLEPLADDEAFQQRWRQVKLAAKLELAALLKLRTGIDVNPESLFDIQVKRIHEYKRQH